MKRRIRRKRHSLPLAFARGKSHHPGIMGDKSPKATQKKKAQQASNKKKPAPAPSKKK